MKCKNCYETCIKKGKRNRVQRYFCKRCKKYQQNSYTYDISEKDETFLKQLNNEGVGISSISRLMKIPTSTVQRIIESLGKKVKKPEFTEVDQSYEIDELRTYIGKKENQCWVAYAINRATGDVIDLVVGRRTKVNLKKKWLIQYWH